MKLIHLNNALINLKAIEVIALLEDLFIFRIKDLIQQVSLTSSDLNLLRKELDPSTKSRQPRPKPQIQPGVLYDQQWTAKRALDFIHMLKINKLTFSKKYELSYSTIISWERNPEAVLTSKTCLKLDAALKKSRERVA